MKKIGLYFGSFNPLHNGHLNVANQVYYSEKFDEIWFVVSPHNPLKNIDDLFDFKLRCKLVKKSIKKIPYFKICKIEKHLPKPHYTANTLDALKKMYPYDFSMIIGEDLIENMKKWENVAKLLNDTSIICYTRFENLNHDLSMFKDIKLVKGPIMNFSATDIRHQIKTNIRFTKFLIPKPVYKHFLKQNKKIKE